MADSKKKSPAIVSTSSTNKFLPASSFRAPLNNLLKELDRYSVFPKIPVDTLVSEINSIAPFSKVNVKSLFPEINTYSALSKTSVDNLFSEINTFSLFSKFNYSAINSINLFPKLSNDLGFGQLNEIKVGNYVKAFSNSNWENYSIRNTNSSSRGIEDDSTENNVNHKRLMKFKNEFSKHLISLIKDQHSEYGFYTDADKLFQGCLTENSVVAKEWLNDIFISNFSNSTLSAGILRVVSHFDYDVMYPQGMTMALAGFTHKETEVNECAIRAFENWGNSESLNILRSVDVKEGWLKSYLVEVIADMTETLS